MDRVAAAANVSKRTLYLRFGSKDDLVMRAIEHGFSCHIFPASSSRPPEGPVGERLLFAATRMLNAALRPEVQYLNNLGDWAIENAPEVHQRMNRMLHEGPVLLIRSILEQAAAEGEIIVDDLDMTALFVFDALVRTPRYRVANAGEMANTPRAKRDYLDHTLRLLLKALAP